MTEKTVYLPYKVKDISLADWGRKEIELAEAEMPGLMALQKEDGESKPLDRKQRNASGCFVSRRRFPICWCVIKTGCKCKPPPEIELCIMTH